MAGRGVHFAIRKEQYEKLLAVESDDELKEIIQEEIEEEWDEEWLRETDKAWDAIHRSLTDGKLGYENGNYPLNAVILGGEQLYGGDDYIVALVKPEQAIEVAEALKSIDKEFFKEGYDKIDREDYDGPHGADDFEYTWEWFKGLQELFEKAGNTGRAIIFTVDQ